MPSSFVQLIDTNKRMLKVNNLFSLNFAYLLFHFAVHTEVIFEPHLAGAWAVVEVSRCV
jgi:hypothetical protein